MFSMSRLVVDLFMVIARNGIHLASGPNVHSVIGFMDVFLPWKTVWRHIKKMTPKEEG